MCPIPETSNRGGLGGENGATDPFPINMRVLAVDDDKTCLGILEKMLRKCQYQVTTESRAVEALRMLRENRDKFDLVISDVKMPDIDGLELLKVVGLEMDLPVIMLSDYTDTNLVMEGITHGACDYLSKPVRIQELKNIWQHVVRRRKFEPKIENNVPSHCPDPFGSGEVGFGPKSSGNDYQSENSDRKRKDRSDEDEKSEDGEEDGPEDDDSSRQKKPRVVWSMELHHKFMEAVNQLGLDKAVPKKILDLMNVEGLTRENVASHLQKFRIYLKKMHQDKMGAVGGKNPAYLSMASLDGLRDFHTLGGSGRFSNASPSKYPHAVDLGRMNSLSGLRFRGVSPSGLIQPSLSQNLNNSFSTQSSSLFRGVPPSLDPTSFVSCSSNPLVNKSSLYDHSSLRMGSGHQSSIQFCTSGSSNGSWQGSNQPVSFPSHSLPLSAPFAQSQSLPPNSFMDTFSPNTPHISNNPLEMPRGADCSYDMNNTLSTLHSLLSPDGTSMDQNTFVNSIETGTSLVTQSSSGLGVGMRSDMEFLLEQPKSHDGYVESLDDVMNALDKREQSAPTTLDGEYIWV